MRSKMRIGHGFDVHRFAPRASEHKPLILGGVTLPDALSLEAHSDGDVVLHALCDALLGAIGEGDIGRHFPDTNAQYAGVSSVFLLEQVCSLVSARGFALSMLDKSSKGMDLLPSQFSLEPEEEVYNKFDQLKRNAPELC